MPTHMEVLEAQVMQLDAAERAHLLERLVLSLDKDPEVEASWEREADRREAELQAGTATLVPFEEAMFRLRARLAK